jgi:ferredoxin
MRVLIDMNRCESYGQCVYAAGAVFAFRGRESLEYDRVPPGHTWADVRRAASACPVGAIRLGEAPEDGVCR